MGADTPDPLVIWDDKMLGYTWGGRHPMHPLRWELTWKLATDLGVLDGISITAPPPATDEELSWVHSEPYLRAVQRASAAGPGAPVGFGIGGDDNPAFAGMHEAAALLAGGSILAGRAIADGSATRAVHIAGGMHHAMRSRAAGFCVYNDPALAIEAMLRGGLERVAYLDTDVHHGDGVQAAFADDPRVLTISIHESPVALWPGTGFASEVGHGAASGSMVNLALPPGTNDAMWLKAFHAVVPGALGAFRPQALVSQHGCDSHRDDPLADLNLTVDGHRQIFRAVRTLADRYADGRWLALGGGGYSVADVVPRSWTMLLATVLDRDLDPRTEIPQHWQDAAHAARPHLRVPTVMHDGRPEEIEFSPWDGSTDSVFDRAINDTRRAVFPLLGLDPHDPRD